MTPLAVVLAGGKGTRVQRVLPGIPKPLAPVAGKHFLEWVLRYLRRQGVRRAVLSAGYGAEQLARFASTAQIAGLRVECVAEPQPLGTAGGFMHAWRTLQPPDREVLAVNGDSLALAELGPLAAALPAGGSAMLAVRVPDAGRYGSVTVDDGGRLAAFAEKQAHAGAGSINAGVYLFSREAVDAFPDRTPLSFESDVFPALLGAGRHVQVVSADAPFLDIGTEASMAQADGFIAENRRWFGD